MNLQALAMLSLLVVGEDAISVAVEVGHEEVDVPNGEVVHVVVTRRGQALQGLPEESVDLQRANAATGVAVEASEGSEGLEVWVSGQALALALDGDLLRGNGLEEVFKLKLGLNSNHPFNFICDYICGIEVISM